MLNLIIQSAQPLEGGALEFLQAFLPNARIVQIDAYALRVRVPPSAAQSEIRAWCAAHRFDCAWVKPMRLEDFGLLVIDMDSTLITIECLDEIADFGGLKREVAALTEASMRGDEMDFGTSLKRRVALLKGLDADILEQVFAERLELSPGAENLLSGVRKAGLRTLLISSGFTFFTERLTARLGFDGAYANTLDIQAGQLTGKVIGEIVNARLKARLLRHACAQYGIAPARAIAIGDGANDLQMLAAAGLSVAFRAKPIVRDVAHVALDFAGLDGVLRLFEKCAS